MSFTPIQLTSKAANRYEFDIENVDLSIVNGIRRTILSDIPNLGFRGESNPHAHSDEDSNPTVTIHKNTTPLHNEFMMHRISLIPIHFSEEAVESFTEDEYIFECDVKNTTANTIPITTHHFTGKRNNLPLTEKELHQLFPVNSITKEPILITRLRQGEELAFTAKVVKSTASEHAAFSPVSLCTFFYTPKESVKMGLERERDYFKNDYGDPSHIRFLLEPECALTPKYLVTKALEIMLQKIDVLYQHPEYIKASSIANTFEITIPNETDTIGNIIQSLLFNKYIREKNKVLNNKYDVSYVGYYMPHPLEKTVVVKITLQHETFEATQEEYVQVMQEGLKFIEAEVRNVYMAWLNSQV